MAIDEGADEEERGGAEKQSSPKPGPGCDRSAFCNPESSRKGGLVIKAIVERDG